MTGELKRDRKGDSQSHCNQASSVKVSYLNFFTFISMKYLSKGKFHLKTNYIFYFWSKLKQHLDPVLKKKKKSYPSKGFVLKAVNNFSFLAAVLVP